MTSASEAKNMKGKRAINPFLIALNHNISVIALDRVKTFSKISCYPRNNKPGRMLGDTSMAFFNIYPLKDFHGRSLPVNHQLRLDDNQLCSIRENENDGFFFYVGD